MSIYSNLLRFLLGTCLIASSACSDLDFGGGADLSSLQKKADQLLMEEGPSAGAGALASKLSINLREGLLEAGVPEKQALSIVKESQTLVLAPNSGKM